MHICFFSGKYVQLVFFPINVNLCFKGQSNAQHKSTIRKYNTMYKLQSCNNVSILFCQVQCHTYTGYCWCVTPDGKPVSGSSVQNKTPVCSGIEESLGNIITWLVMLKRMRISPLLLRYEFFLQNVILLNLFITRGCSGSFQLQNASKCISVCYIFFNNVYLVELFCKGSYQMTVLNSSHLC